MFALPTQGCTFMYLIYFAYANFHGMGIKRARRYNKFLENINLIIALKASVNK